MAKRKKRSKKSSGSKIVGPELFMVGLVGIVAVVGIIVLMIGDQGMSLSLSEGDLTGEAYSFSRPSTLTKSSTDCTDHCTTECSMGKSATYCSCGGNSYKCADLR
jgi:hypothetical protein